MATIYELTLEELEELLAMSPRNSACARAGIAQLEQIIADKKLQLQSSEES